MSSASLEDVRAWFHANKSTPAFHLAEKRWHEVAGTPLASQVKAIVGGDTDEEQELGAVRALTLLILRDDPCAVLLAAKSIS